MIRAKIILLTAAVALLTFPGAVFADETIVCRFTGTVTLDSAAVTDGTIIKAIIGDDEYTTTTPTRYGPSTYSIAIQPEDGKNYPDGTEVSFTINGYPADRTGTLQAGKNIRWDLNASSTPASIPTPSSRSAASTNVWLIVGLVIACIAQASLVGGVAYIAVTDWNK